MRSLNIAVCGAVIVTATTVLSIVTPAAGTQRAAVDDVAVDRDRSGSVVQIRSESGRALRPAPDGASTRAAAVRHAARYAPSFGVAGDDLRITRVTPHAHGGSVVRLQQQVDGLPVLGGELVMSLDADGGLRSVVGKVADNSGVAAASFPSTRAVGVATASVAKRHDRSPEELTAQLDGDWFYDPALLGAPGRLEPRRVWRVEVADGAAVAETVLVDSVNGRVLLHVDRVMEAVNRQVCDGENLQNPEYGCAGVQSPARTETGPASAVTDVNQAFELTGATAQMYADVAGLDLTQLIGSGGATKLLTSWVRYCPTADVDPTCPMPNAFWNGTSTFFGEGYAAADDVVAHEMTHGVIEKFSDLFYFHQSGAINESLADVMGEILDHRNPSASDAADDWRLGEDLPGGAIRDLADPTLFGQPDRVTSPLYDADPTLADNGGVHTNSGIGNKTAYLISQGGSFNGITVDGIDADDPTLVRTATLYGEVIKRLTSGAGWADLARTLEQTCVELAAVGTAGFTDTDCASVTAAIRATELLARPTVAGAAAPPDVTDACPAGMEKVTLFSNPGSMAGLRKDSSYLWTTSPHAAWGVPRNARTGTTSLFGFDPDPYNYGDPYSGQVEIDRPVKIPAGQPTYLHFDHWRSFEWHNSSPPEYDDGGQVAVFAAPSLAGPFTAQTPSGDAWVNGPSERLDLLSPSNPVPGFGGNSNGWTSSRLDLSSLAGQEAIVRWIVRGDAAGSTIGWFLDNLQVYTCHTPIAPGPVEQLGSAPLSGPRVRLTWNAPTNVGDGLTGYLVTGSGGYRQELPVETTETTTEILESNANHTFTVQTLGPGGLTGAVETVQVMTPTITLTTPPSSVRKGTRVAFKGTVFAAGTLTPATGKYVNLQWRRPGSTTWRTRQPDGSVLYGPVRDDGTFKIVTVTRTTLHYRALLPTYPNWFRAVSSAVKVRVRG